MIERLSRPRVAPEDRDDVYRAQAGEAPYPSRYLACPICKVPKGQSCLSRSGRIINGRPDDVRTELDHPHNARKISRCRPK